jgi:hypothetical protein
MKRKTIVQAVVTIAIAFAFLLPSSAALANTKENMNKCSTTQANNPTNWVEEAKLVPSDGAPPTFFGFSVGISGDTAVGGAWMKDGLKGAAYVYTRTGSNWTQTIKLTASDGTPPDEFGYSVAIDGDYIIVGAYNDNSGQGSAYIFNRIGTNWTQEAKIEAADGIAGDGFGFTVAINDATVIVGAWRDENITGAAYVFTRNGTTWTQQAKLTASDGEVNDEFGYSVSTSGDVAIVGARNDEAATGSAYIYRRAGTAWTEEAKLVASDGAPEDLFGLSVSISGDTAVAGAAGNISKTGTAYVYRNTGTTWTEEAKLVGSDSQVGGGFAWAVAIENDSLAAGSPGGDANNGTAYVFSRTGTAWTEEAKLTASDAMSGDFLGISVSINGGSVIAGAFGDNGYIGSACVFRKAVVLEIGTFKSGLGSATTVQNIGIAPATNVQWTITVTGGLLGLINKTAGDTITSLAAGAISDPLKTGVFFGFGPITITITVTCDQGASVEKTASGTQLIIFTLVQ